MNLITVPVQQTLWTPVYLLKGEQPSWDDNVGGQLDLQVSLLTGLGQWSWLTASLKGVLTSRFWYG